MATLFHLRTKAIRVETVRVWEVLRIAVSEEDDQIRTNTSRDGLIPCESSTFHRSQRFEYRVRILIVNHDLPMRRSVSRLRAMYNTGGYKRRLSLMTISRYGRAFTLCQSSPADSTSSRNRCCADKGAFQVTQALLTLLLHTRTGDRVRGVAYRSVRRALHGQSDNHLEVREVACI